jgi:hypothetical protein
MPTKSFPAKRKPPHLRRNGCPSLPLSRHCKNRKADLTNGRRETKEDEARRKGSLSLSLICGPTQEKKHRIESIDHQNPEHKNPEKNFSQFFQQIQTKATKPSHTHQSKAPLLQCKTFSLFFCSSFPPTQYRTQEERKTQKTPTLADHLLQCKTQTNTYNVRDK